MAFTDWMKRGGQQQQPVAQTPQPENAKQKYTRDAAIEAASSKPVQQLPDTTKSAALDAGRPANRLMEQATSHQAAPAAAAGDHASGKEALMHNQSAPGKSQEAMSPTDSGKGQTKSQARQQSRGIER